MVFCTCLVFVFFKQSSVFIRGRGKGCGGNGVAPQIYMMCAEVLLFLSSTGGYKSPMKLDRTAAHQSA